MSNFKVYTTFNKSFGRTAHLLEDAPKAQFWGPLTNRKFEPSPRAHTHPDPIINKHTEHVKNYRFIMACIELYATGQSSLLGLCNKIICFWSPPASILRAIPKNYYYSAHALLCNYAMLVEHVKNWRWRYLMLHFILTIRGCLAGNRCVQRHFHNAVLPSVVDDVVIIIIITACPHQK